MDGSTEKKDAVTLVVGIGDRFSERTFAKESITIGRSEQNDLVVNTAKISRFHCRIVREGTRVYIEDSGSRNGTFVNDEQILRRDLNCGDAILVGDTMVYFEALPAGEDDSSRETAQTRLDDGAALSKDLVPRLMRERSNFFRLLAVNKALNSEMDLRLLLELIIDSVIELTRAERGFLITLQEGDMEFEVARNFMETEVDHPELAISRSIAGQVMKDQKPVMSINAREDERFSSVQSIANLGLRSVLCVPLVVRGECVGAVYVDNRLNQAVFSSEDRAVLEAFAEQAAIAIQNARRMEELRQKNAELNRVQKKISRMNEKLSSTVRSQKSELLKAKARLERTGGDSGVRYHYGRIVGNSREMTRIISLLERVIDSDFPVLIQGESGTGKDLVASAIHFNSERADAPFVSENCAALPDTLLESELFGHARGAFTGAISMRKGLLEMADNGTLFLDEVGDMSPSMQTKLLRFLQDGEFRPLGNPHTVRVNVRIISASNRPLRELVERGEFRQDLFYRINVLPVKLPPLRERKEDIPLLVSHFVANLCGEMDVSRKEVDPKVLDCLCRYDWPGNVRELENEIRRLVTLSRTGITMDLLSDRIRRAPERSSLFEEIEDLPLADKVEAIERLEITAALREFNGNKSRAARKLGISRFTLQRKLEKYELAWEEGK